VVDKNEDGTVKKNEDGSDKLKEKEKFPMSWTDEHFKTGTDVYLTSDSSLSVEERHGLKVLQEYVASLEPAKLVTRAGEPVLDEEGNEQFVPRLINTKRLLECRTRAEVHEVLGRQFDLFSALFVFISLCSVFVIFLSSALTCVFSYLQIPWLILTSTSPKLSPTRSLLGEQAKRGKP
jgi:hypothetical protein